MRARTEEATSSAVCYGEDRGVCLTKARQCSQPKRRPHSDSEARDGEKKRKMFKRSISFFSTHSYQKTNKKKKGRNSTSLLFAYWNLSSFFLNVNVAKYLLIFSPAIPFTKIPAAMTWNKYEGKALSYARAKNPCIYSGLKEKYVQY